jgi:hypothetical protein
VVAILFEVPTGVPATYRVVVVPCRVTAMWVQVFVVTDVPDVMSAEEPVYTRGNPLAFMYRANPVVFVEPVRLSKIYCTEDVDCTYTHASTVKSPVK